MRRIKLCSKCGSPTPHHLRRLTEHPLCGSCHYLLISKPYRSTRPDVIRSIQRRYERSPKGKLHRIQYESTAKGKARLSKYRGGAKYKSAVERYESTERRKTLKKLWETVGRWKVPSRLIKVE